MKKIISLSAILMAAGQAFAETDIADGGSSVFAVPGTYIIIVVILALVIAFIVVGSMKAKLKTAAMHDNAMQYIREGSLRLDIERDQYLYQTSTRRKIETDDKKD